MTSAAATASIASTARQRPVIATAATLALVGIGLSAVGSEDLAAWPTAGAIVVLVAALHYFGRTGPDDPLRLAP